MMEINCSKIAHCGVFGSFGRLSQHRIPQKTLGLYNANRPAGLALKLRRNVVLLLGYQMTTREHTVHQGQDMTGSYDERRRYYRIKLQVPLFVRGKDAYGDQFLELAKTLDISALGALITCARPLEVNEIIALTIPAPSITSSALVPSGMPPIQAKVKRQQEAGDVHLVGVEFLKPIG
jgi:hypothetical protein